MESKSAVAIGIKVFCTAIVPFILVWAGLGAGAAWLKEADITLGAVGGAGVGVFMTIALSFKLGNGLRFVQSSMTVTDPEILRKKLNDMSVPLRYSISRDQDNVIEYSPAKGGGMMSYPAVIELDGERACISGPAQIVSVIAAIDTSGRTSDPSES